MASNERQQRQIEQAERLQDLVLNLFEAKLTDGSLTDTGLATLVRLLHSNGWSIDPTRVPQGLRDKLTANVPTKFEDGDEEAIAGAIDWKVAR